MPKRSGRKSAAQTPAPPSERIFGSKKNPKGSASSEKTAKSIKLSSSTLRILEKKLKEFKDKYPSKTNITLNDLKAVYRRGAGAYSKSHRPTITGGVPNTRNAWSLARVNKFLKKAAGEKVKAAYVQDDDLLKMEDGGATLLAPNGQPSNLTPEQWKLVRTPEFKEWFGDWENDPSNASKVVDENGEPLVVWHTTDKEFTIFNKKKSKDGFFFSPQKERLSVYNKKNIAPYFLNLRNPSHEIFKSDLIYLLSKGYDGIIDYGYAKHLGNRNLYEIIAFEPNQIKLADGTNTTFDPNSEDIRYEEGGEVKLYDYKDEDEHKITFDYVSNNIGVGKLILTNDPLYDLGFDNVFEIRLLYVNKDYRGEGIANQLIKSAIKWAKDNNVDWLISWISVHSDSGLTNKEMVGFLKRYGFEYIDTKYDRDIVGLRIKEMYEKGGKILIAPNKEYYRWYLEWYNPILRDINIFLSLPNALTPSFIGGDDSILIELIEKINPSINAKEYLQKMVDKADELGIKLYLQTSPRHKYLKSDEHRDKITKEYLTNYFEHFGFQNFKDDWMVRNPSSYSHKEFAKGGATLLAPNGKPSNLTAEQYKLVRTPEFKAWFGDWENDPENASKVVDENGEPLVVYHGSKSYFSKFEIEKGGESSTAAKVGFWFSPIKGFAYNFAYTAWWGSLKEPIVYETFLSLKNPKIFVTDESRYGDSYEKFKTDLYKISGQSESDANIGGIGMALHNQKETIKKYRELLNYDGYDGIIIYNTRFDKSVAGGLNNQYVALYPEQIKLADGSNTTFDSTNPDIRYRDGGFLSSIGQSLINLKKNGIVLNEGNVTLVCYNTGNANRNLSLYNQSLIYKVVSKIDKDVASKIIVNLNHGIYDEFDENEIYRYKKSDHLILMNQNEVLYDSSNPDIRYEEGGAVDDEVIKQRWDKKKKSLSSMDENIRSLRYNITKDLKSEDEKTRLTALAISLMDKTAERVGNGVSASNGHYGVTGLLKKHIKISGNTISLNYTGKSGVEHEKQISDELLAKTISQTIKDSPSNRVFTTSDGFDIKEDKINRYLSEYDVTAKDLRGYAANRWIIAKLNLIPKSQIPEEEYKRKKLFNKVVKSVAQKIGHGSATLKKHYMLPKLENEFIENGKVMSLSDTSNLKFKDGGKTGGDCQLLDENGERRIDPEAIKKLDECVDKLPQTKSLHYNKDKNDYDNERKELHRKIIYDIKKDVSCIGNTKPIAILMGGSPASGKSTFVRRYAPFLMQHDILKIDADEIRAKLPEYKGWNASQTHLETKDIVNTLLSDRNIGLPCPYDIIYDGTMNSAKNYEPLISLLKSLGYKIYIIYIDKVPKDVVKQRNLDRYKRTGRFVPTAVIDDFFEKGTAALNKLKEEVDGYMIIDGSTPEYKLLEKGGKRVPKTRSYSKIGYPAKIDIKDVIKEFKQGGEVDEVNTGTQVINNLDTDPLDSDSEIASEMFEKGGETFEKRHGKNNYVQLSKQDLDDYAEELLELIKTAYSHIGGHHEFLNLENFKNTDLNFWLAQDLDADPEADVLLAGKTTPFGTKITTTGQDGSTAAKFSAIKKLSQLLKEKGYYAEMDENLAEKFHLDTIKDENIIRKVINKPDIKYIGDGIYTRGIAGKTKEKVLVGVFSKDKFKAGGEIRFNKPIFWHEKEGNWLTPKDQIYMWLYDEPDAAKKLNSGQYDHVLFPMANPIMAWKQGYTPPLFYIWTKKFQNKTKGSEHLIGIIRAYYNREKNIVTIDMMTTRKDMRRKGVMGYMIKVLREYLDLPKENVVFNEPTKEGKKLEESGKYESGGELSDEDKKETYKKWRTLVNMSKGELEKFYQTEEGKKAGLTPEQASKAGIDSGRESARWIIKMKETSVKDWTPNMWRWAKKQISFISRMSGNKGSLYDDKGNKTRKHTSLLIWGHNPEKKSAGALIDSKPNNYDMNEYTYNNLPAISEVSDGKQFLLKEEVFRGGEKNPKHHCTRYMVVESMGKGGMLNTLNLKVLKTYGDNSLMPNQMITRPIKNIINKGRELGDDIKSSFKKGGELNPDDKKIKEYVEHKSGDAGGMLVGRRHSEGGIKAINNGTGDKIEMEGGEVVITRDAVSDPSLHEFDGKQMTNREILSAINTSGGGVAFADGGDVSCKCSGKHYKFGGKSMTDKEIVDRINRGFGSKDAIKKGIETEDREHGQTFKMLQSGELTYEQFLKRLVTDHLSENPNYYESHKK